MKALLAELQQGLKEGEDPLYYALPRAAPDPACVGADAARVYVAPREVPGVVRPVVETVKVSVTRGVDPRRAAGEQEGARRVRGAWILAAALGLVAGGIAVMVLRGTPGREAAESAALKSREKGGNSISTQAETLPYRINYGERPLEAEQIWRTMFDQVLLEKRPPREALDTATEAMNAALASTEKQRLFTERNYVPPSA